MWKEGFVVLSVVAAISAADQKCGQTKEPSLGVADSSVFPWVGLVYYERDDKPPETLAVGTLIDSRHVLVPAYVTKPPNRQVLKYIQFGAVDVENAQTAQNYTIEKIFTHPEYSTAERPRSKINKNDIAVIRLEKPVTLSDSVSPACLPVKDKNYDVDQYHFVSYNIGTSPYEDIKGRKYISLLPRVTSAECVESYSKYGSTITAENIASYICAGDKENDSCKGDAGSPILKKDENGWTAVALSIFGPTICRSGIPSAFLTIQPHTEWIQSVISS